MRYCEVEDCFRQAERGGTRCGCHEKGRALDGPLFVKPKRIDHGPWNLLAEAAISYSDAPPEDEGEYRTRANRLRHAAQVYTRSLSRRRSTV